MRALIPRRRAGFAGSAEIQIGEFELACRAERHDLSAAQCQGSAVEALVPNREAYLSGVGNGQAEMGRTLQIHLAHRISLEAIARIDVENDIELGAVCGGGDQLKANAPALIAADEASPGDGQILAFARQDQRNRAADRESTRRLFGNRRKAVCRNVAIEFEGRGRADGRGGEKAGRHCYLKNASTGRHQVKPPMQVRVRQWSSRHPEGRARASLGCDRFAVRVRGGFEARDPLELRAGHGVEAFVAARSRHLAILDAPLGRDVERHDDIALLIVGNRIRRIILGANPIARI